MKTGITNKKDLNLKVKHDRLRNIEYIGDSLLAFIVRDYLHNGKVNRESLRITAGKIESNQHLAKVFDVLKYKLIPLFGMYDITKSQTKAKANQIEYMIYKMYGNKGFEETLGRV